MAKSKTADKIIQETCQKLFKLAEVDAKVEVRLTAGEGEEQDVVEVNIDTTQDAGLLIGRRGETLGAIQSFLALVARQKTEEWTRVLVNVGDWRDKEEERLMSLARQAAERAQTTGESQTLYNLNASQRRVVHMSLGDDDKVETLSEGEGRERYLVVKPK